MKNAKIWRLFSLRNKNKNKSRNLDLTSGNAGRDKINTSNNKLSLRKRQGSINMHSLFLKADLLLLVFLLSPPAFPDLRARLRDLFLFLLRKENNLQILAFLINNCLHLKNSIW